MQIVHPIVFAMTEWNARLGVMETSAVHLANYAKGYAALHRAQGRLIVSLVRYAKWMGTVVCQVGAVRVQTA